MAVKPIVLVVDDEARTRALERHVLETGPYAVLEASGAPEAFTILEAGQAIDLLIADLDMPELPGEERREQGDDGLRFRHPLQEIRRSGKNSESHESGGTKEER